MQTTRSPHRQNGTSLIELLMGLAIAAVLICMALPGLNRFMRKRQVEVTRTIYMTALHLARLTAMTKNRRVIFCPSTDAQRCNNTSDWSKGWLLTYERPRNGQGTASPIRAGQLSSHITVISSAGRHHIRFLPDGSAHGSNGSLLFCHAGSSLPDAEPGPTLSLVISQAGRIRSGAATEVTKAQADRCATASTKSHL